MASKKQGAAPALPVMYSAISQLNVQEHGALKLRPSPTNFAFARGLNSIPLAAIEVPNAASNYPIVFGYAGDEAAIFAISGTKAGENRFVDGAGVWRADCYIPAFVRRYPFILVSNTEQEKLTLAVDTSSDMLSQDSGEALYSDASPSKTALAALDFCSNLRTQLQLTAALVKSIEDAGLLEARRAEVTLPDGEKSVLTGFNVVDEAKLNALDDETFLTLRRSGALVVIYSHLWSMREWKNLLA